MYVSAQTAYRDGISNTLEAALRVGLIKANDIVWSGPSGDYVVGDEAYDEEYADYSDSGSVAEFIHEADADTLDQ